jgi:hypothetical protein
MAITRDELGNYYDDGVGGDSFHDFTGTNDFGSFNDFSGYNPSESVFDPSYGGQYSSSVAMPPTQNNGIANYLKSLNLTNAGGIAGALAGATGAFTNAPKKAYEGKIPQYEAIRNMVTAPPTANYRPGQGGVNYGGNVSYVPRGTMPAGVGGTMTPAAIAAATNAANANRGNSTISNIAKVAGTAGITSLLSNILSGKTNAAGITDLLKKAGIISGNVGDVGFSSKKVGDGSAATTKTDTANTATKTDTANTATKTGTPAGGGSGAAPNVAGIANAVRSIGGGGANTTDGGLATPEGDYAGEDEFAGIDEQIAANENDLETPNELSDEEIEEELARVAAETDEEYGTGEDDTSGDDTTFSWDEDMGSDFDFGSGDDYSDFSFGSGDDDSFDLSDLEFARGGRINMAKGRYLQGKTDGMADKIPARIGKNQPAALSHGEFVVPADVVSHLGNGNSDAGAKKLYQMMDKIRVARTGTKQQGKQINPDKFMPGGLANAYAQGGSVKRFVEGGSTAATGIGSAVNAGVLGTETGPNSWAGDYMSNMLGKSQALSESPYQQYMGPLTAGASGLQDKVFTGLQNTTFPGNLGQSFSSAGAYQTPTMGTNGATPTTPAASTQPQGIASQYMNPYLQSVLDPQLAELRRQNDITNMGTNAKLTSAGAFGGGRNAIMNAENNRNMMQEMNKTVGAGYANAYDKAQQQFNTEQTQGRSLADLIANQGGMQRGIEAEGIAADKAAFEAARENPYKMLQFQQSMLQGMPVSATSYNIAQPTKLQEIMAGAAGGAKAVGKSDKTIADLLKQLGL